jgi:hypothetical protein
MATTSSRGPLTRRTVRTADEPGDDGGKGTTARDTTAVLLFYYSHKFGPGRSPLPFPPHKNLRFSGTGRRGELVASVELSFWGVVENDKALFNVGGGRKSPAIVVFWGFAEHKVSTPPGIRTFTEHQNIKVAGDKKHRQTPNGQQQA